MIDNAEPIFYILAFCLYSGLRCELLNAMEMFIVLQPVIYFLTFSRVMYIVTSFIQEHRQREPKTAFCGLGIAGIVSFLRAGRRVKSSLEQFRIYIWKWI